MIRIAFRRRRRAFPLQYPGEFERGKGTPRADSEGVSPTLIVTPSEHRDEHAKWIATPKQTYWEKIARDSMNSHSRAKRKRERERSKVPLLSSSINREFPVLTEKRDQRLHSDELDHEQYRLFTPVFAKCYLYYI